MDSANLTKAQTSLSQFESHIDQSDSARLLSDGLDSLYEVVMDSSNEAAKARAIGDRYVTVAVKHLEKMLSTGSATEPELEGAYHLTKVLAEYEFGDAERIKRVTSETFSQLFAKQYTGYSDQEVIKIIKAELERREHRT